MTTDDACRSVYQGDAALDRMLAKAGAMVNANEAKAIIAGVLAAPSGRGRLLLAEHQHDGRVARVALELEEALEARLEGRGEATVDLAREPREDVAQERREHHRVVAPGFGAEQHPPPAIQRHSSAPCSRRRCCT